MSETSRRQTSMSAQQPQQTQQEQQKGPHPSVLLQEVHAMLKLQGAQLDALTSSEQDMGSAVREALTLQSAMLDDALASLQDLTSAVQTIFLTLKTHHGGEIDQIEDDEPEMAEAYDDEEPDQDDIADQETAVLPSSWMDEEEPEAEEEPARRRATEAATLTGESFASRSFAGPRPLILPTPSRRSRKHRGVQAWR